jgi:hypothetical protein
MWRTKNHTATGLGCRLLASISVIGALMAVLAVIAIQQRPDPPASTRHFVALSPMNQTDSTRRTVVIAPGGAELPNLSAADKLLMTSLVGGQLPSQAMQAIVQTDSNCQPDEHGVSHCLNELAIGSVTLMVRHHHKMSDVPCLTPGETVTILSLEQYKRL